MELYPIIPLVELDVFNFLMYFGIDIGELSFGELKKIHG